MTNDVHVGSPDVPPAVAEYLRSFERRTKRRTFCRSMGFMLLALMICMAVCCALDRMFRLPGNIRFWLLMMCIGLGVVVLGRALWKFSRKANWVDLAAQVESGDARFQQSLLTVVSQLAGDRAARGSEEILFHLQRDVESNIASAPNRSPVTLSSVMAPWLVCLCLLAVAVTAMRGPRIGAVQLFERLIFPSAAIPPVTTTQLAVFPGNIDFVQSQPLQISANVEHLSGDSVFLNLNTQGDWYRTVMNSPDGVHFSYLLTSIDRDVRYCIAAGDAQSPTYLARVLRRPSVTQFRISYEFPDYVRRPPLTVNNTDGLIQAPADSRVTLTIVCNENLQSALLTIGAEKILMARTGDPASRQAVFTVKKDTRYALDLISERDVAGAGPPGTRILQLVNQPPIARLFQAGGELRLTPRDAVSLTYQAADDYALAALALRVQINKSQQVDLPIRLLGNRRGQQGSVRLDLANLPLKIGDVATVSVFAQDSAGQTTTSQPLHIDVSTRPVDLDMQQRVVELESAGGFATKLISDLQAARQAIAHLDNNADRQSNAYAAASAQANLSLANASESATLLRQCLCRTILHTHSSQECVALCQWSDEAQVLAQAADALFQLRGDPAGVAQSLDPQLQRSIDQAHRLAGDIGGAWQAQMAAVLTAERDDLEAMKQKPSSPTIDAQLQSLKIDPAAPDIPQRLRGLVDAGNAIVRSARPIDYSAAARGWVDDLSRGVHSNPGLDRRLAAAAEAEAVRPDADLERARDLQLASHAAAAIAASLAEKQPEESAAAASANAFASALAALQHEYDLHHQPGGAVPPDLLKTATLAADAARERLLSWAPDVSQQAPLAAAGGYANPQTSAALPKRDAEDLALQASAASAAKDYDRAAKLDDALGARLKEPSPIRGGAPREPDGQLEAAQERVAASMSAAQKIDGIGQKLNAVVKQTRDESVSEADDLVARQREVADQISDVVTQTEDSSNPNRSEPNSRERAVAAFLSVQEQLAAIPQVLSDVQLAAAANRSAADRVRVAQSAESRLGAHASGDERGMAHRAAAEAVNEATEASDRLEASISSISAARAAGWADELGAYAPESTSVCNAIQTQLVAALNEFSRAVRDSDAQTVDRAASAVRTAIEFVQRELVGAQDAITDRDPLVAAKSFAGAAADSLAQSPPDLNGALQEQVRATGALARAWDQSIHDAASQRLSVVPALQPVYGPMSPGAASPWADAARGAGWGHLQPRETESLNFIGHDSDPSGYEESLRIYFQALGKAQDAHAQGH